MALPTKEKTWEYDVNKACAESSVALYYFKESLKNSFTTKWAVWGSSWGTGSNYGNNDGVDRWPGAPPTAYNWFVLKNTALGSNVSLCIQYAAWLGVRGWSLAVAPNGFLSNGTVTSRPTAPDEFALCTDAGTLNYTVPLATHTLQSSDGLMMYHIKCYNNYCYAFLMMGRPKSPIASWTTPVIIAGTRDLQSYSDATVYGNWNDSSNIFAKVGSAQAKMYLTSEGYGGGTVGENITVPDDDTGEYICSPVSLVSDTLGGRGALKGKVYDLWWGPTSLATGSTFPGDGSNQFAYFKHLIFPWNGSVPLIA